MRDLRITLENDRFTHRHRLDCLLIAFCGSIEVKRLLVIRGIQKSAKVCPRPLSLVASTSQMLGLADWRLLASTFFFFLGRFRYSSFQSAP